MSEGFIVEPRHPDDQRAAEVIQAVIDAVARRIYHEQLAAVTARVILAAFYDEGPPRLIPTVARDGQSVLPDDTAEVLLDFAHQGRRQDFDDLAGCAGVDPSRYAELWAGTRRRLGLEL